MHDLIEDMQAKMVHMFFEKDEKRQTEMKQTLQEKDLPEFLRILKSVSQVTGPPRGGFMGQRSPTST